MDTKVVCGKQSVREVRLWLLQPALLPWSLKSWEAMPPSRNFLCLACPSLSSECSSPTPIPTSTTTNNNLHAPQHPLQAFREAVREGTITWHAMPHVAQLELFDPGLLEYAVQLTHKLDREFGLPPKQTMNQVGRLPAVLTKAGVKAATGGAGWT